MRNKFEFDVFLSHNNVDKPRVRIIAERLQTAGLKVWFDEWIIRPGDDIYLSIEHGLEASRCLVLCMSSAAFRSDWIDLERSTVIFRDPSNRDRRFIPLLLDNCEIPDAIRRYNYIDFRKDCDSIFRRLVESCRSDTDASPIVEIQAEGSDVLIDFSHGQTQWDGFYRKGYYIFEDIDFLPIDSGTLESSGLFDHASVLLFAMPRGTNLTTKEIDFLDEWVSRKGRGLLVMGFYIGDIHHRTNLNALANRFNFSFGHNLLMPKGVISDRQCNHQAFTVKDHTLAVKVNVSNYQHPITKNLHELGFLSSCSLEDITFNPSLIIQTPVVSVMKPLVHRDDDGFIDKILEWKESKRARLPLFAAWKHGRGRVAACGTWKICCQSFRDNQRLMQNLIEWLRPA